MTFDFGGSCAPVPLTYTLGRASCVGATEGLPPLRKLLDLHALPGRARPKGNA